jgi:hypothetical protein
MFALLAVISIAVWTRAFIGAAKDYKSGEDLLNSKEYVRAIAFFDRSLHWYTPLNPYVERSARDLWDISETAEKANDHHLSLMALESIRNSFYSARSFYSPGSAWIGRCDERIKDILKIQDKEVEGGGDSSGNDEHRTDLHYNDPEILWTLIMEAGLFCWIGSILGWIVFCLSPDKRAISVKINEGDEDIDEDNPFLHHRTFEQSAVGDEDNNPPSPQMAAGRCALWFMDIRSYWFWMILLIIGYGLWIIGMIEA